MNLGTFQQVQDEKMCPLSIQAVRNIIRKGDWHGVGFIEKCLPGEVSVGSAA